MKFRTFFVLLFMSFFAHAQTYPTDTVVTPQNIDSMRVQLIGEVFGCGFPITEAQATGSGSFNGYSYQLLSTGAKFFDNGKTRLLIFHAGHNQEALNTNAGGYLIDYALANGWDVLALNMPSGDHSRFSSYAYPLTAFMTPIADSLNYTLVNNTYSEITMTGLSGGGWSTVLYSAMDTRITKSFPVAGSWPKYLRYASGNVNSIGDYEQTLPGLTASYLDLYTMASDNGRTQHQIFNDQDPCCFDGYDSLDYLDEVQYASTNVGGTFDMTIVVNNQHTVDSSMFYLITDTTPPPPPSEDPVLVYWKLDELSGNTVIDDNGVYNGSYVNSPTLGVTGITDGTSVAFDGSSDYATVPDNVNLRPGTGEYAIEMWASFTNTNYGMAFGKFSLTFPYTGPTVFFNYANDTPTVGRIELRDKRASGFRVDSVTTGLNDGVARYYVFQRRKTSDIPEVWKLEIYINGVLDSETVLSSVEDLDTSEQIYLFSRPGASQYVNGVYDDVKYHVRESLTPAEILSNYNAGM